MGRTLSFEEWLDLEDRIDAFSITRTIRSKDKKLTYYRFIFSDKGWDYEKQDFDTILEVWQILDDQGHIKL